MILKVQWRRGKSRPWLATFRSPKNGQVPVPAASTGTSYLKNGRDLAWFLHADIAFQAYLFAAQWMLMPQSGRDMAGAHWRSDGEQALLLGEAVAISTLRDQRATFNEPFDGFTFTKFDGKSITV